VTTMLNRRYTLVEKIGEGGMGTVYRAHDRLTGDEVAMKQVLSLSAPAGARIPGDAAKRAESLRLALAQEFRTLASLRHPNIITVLDYGFDGDDAKPYFTMEWLHNARSILHAGRGLPLQEKIGLIVQVLQALAYLHRRGIVHRDLKPANVLVTKDEPDGLRVRVLDFGLAAIRNTLQPTENVVLGTLHYLAPELLQGKAASEASDMYAVGVIAYELITGKHPFMQDGDDPSDLVIAVLTRAPDLMRLWETTLVNVDSALPPQDDAPTNAPLHEQANVDTVMLAPSHLAGAQPTTASTDAPLGSVTFDDSRDEPTLRLNVDQLETDLANLQQRGSDPMSTDSDAAVHLPSTLPLGTPDFFQTREIRAVGGDNRLIDIFSRLLSKNPAERPVDAQMLIGELCSAVGLPIPPETSAIRESYLQAAAFVGRDEELAQLNAALDSALQSKGSAWLVAGESGVGKSRLLDELRIRALVKGMVVLKGQGATSGTLYHIWRDPIRRLALFDPPDDSAASVFKRIVSDFDTLIGRDIPLDSALVKPSQLAKALTEWFGAQTQPILLLLEDLQWAQDSLDTLESLNQLAADHKLLIVANFRDDESPDLPDQLPTMRFLKLKRLSPQAIADLGAAMLGSAGKKPEVLELLQRETEGNAFFMVEVINALAQRSGRLSAIADSLATGTLPERIFTGGLLQIVQRRLDRVPGEAQPLLRAAAVAGRRLDAAVLRHIQPTVDYGAWLRVCADAAFIEPAQFAGPEVWQFAHDKLREGLLYMMDAEERKRAHRAVAVAIEAVYADDPTVHAVALTEHWYEAGDKKKERQYARHAIKRAHMLSDFHGEIALIKRALEDGGDDTRDSADVMKSMGEALFQLGDFAEAKIHHEKTLAVARRINYAEVEAFALSGLGRISAYQGDYVTARQLIEACLPLYDKAVQAGETPTRAAITSKAACLNDLFVVASMQGDYEYAAKQVVQAIELYRSINNKKGIADCLNYLGNLAELRHDYDEARRLYLESRATYLEMAQRQGVATSGYYLGRLEEEAGNTAEARRWYDDSRAIYEQIGDRYNVADTIVCQGFVCLAEGDPEGAEALFLEGMMIAREMGAMPPLLHGLSGYATLWEHQGKYESSADLLACMSVNDSLDDAMRDVRLKPLREKLVPHFPNGLPAQSSKTAEEWVALVLPSTEARAESPPAVV